MLSGGDPSPYRSPHQCHYNRFPHSILIVHTNVPYQLYTNYKRHIVPMCRQPVSQYVSLQTQQALEVGSREVDVVYEL